MPILKLDHVLDVRWRLFIKPFVCVQSSPEFYISRSKSTTSKVTFDILAVVPYNNAFLAVFWIFTWTTRGAY